MLALLPDEKKMIAKQKRPPSSILDENVQRRP